MIFIKKACLNNLRVSCIIKNCPETENIFLALAIYDKFYVLIKQIHTQIFSFIFHENKCGFGFI